ncbi:hypothetical protein CP863_10560 [Cutibacterium acnes]|uniref:Zinc finger FPG/IleRS-type domain-containing protein n=1 Tax=Cutibacterium acnes TaxID=1747 RepID=A0AAD0QMG2_CUTAC|nr:hypothetical protein DXN06_00065 [Cutibacterium acnes]QAZ51359.1 hypothetical protein cbac_07920 [Cutibacterium acnes KPA171202]MUT17027.1 hypothetical protein [Cutibacterium acnes]MUT48269.1 hypothetical protein [Cutibacterium acnes]MUT76508.1 hypothetical protein [Cutibacterium acnes]
MSTLTGNRGGFSALWMPMAVRMSPCHRCETPIIRESFMNRSSFRCPKCQRPR